MTGEGSGVGRFEGMAVFVPRAAPGDVLEVKIVKVQKTLAYGRIETIQHPSPDRIEPDCAVSGVCGGCAFRHITYEAECQIKEGFVRDAFTRVGGFENPEILPIFGAKEIQGWRNKAQYPCGTDAAGRLCFGFYARRTHRVIPVRDCLLEPPLFGEIRGFLCEALPRYGIEPYSEETGAGTLRHLYLRQGFATGETMVCFVAASPRTKVFGALADELAKAFPQVTSVALNRNDAPGNVILGPKTAILRGEPVIRERIAGVEARLSPESFCQVNPAQAARLFEEARRLADPKKDEVLLDLYCGAGMIGLSMAREVKKVIGVEIVPRAVENARENARLSGADNAEFYISDAARFAQKLAQQGEHPDLIILDPPRKGCDEETIDACARMAPKRVVMISCAPATAARDAARFAQRGYELLKIRPVDLFPRTGHVETAVLMSRGKNFVNAGEADIGNGGETHAL